MSPNSASNRRSFLARSAAIVAVPAVATVAGGALAAPASADTLPDYAPIPPSALGPAVNAQGYYVGRAEKNLYWVTDGAYQAAFLTTREGVVLFDAPPSIGHNLQRAIDQIAAANGVSNTVTHLVYSHHHADHIGGSSLFGTDVVRIKYGNNVWAASQQYLAAVVAYASGPVIKKYLGVLAAADVYTASTTFAILESVRLDLGFGSQVHP
jgi:glyoxylase-like metal-dependent hydrolase (beta-lactamase superfamily II)